MLTEENLQEYINKFQTNKNNIVREYIQHLFLANLYKGRTSEKLLFKGGTALRIIFQSPRFSEDLDFTGQNIFTHQEIDGMFIDALAEMEKVGINVSYKEAKPTTGGYLGLIHYEAFNIAADMKFEVSLRKGKKVSGELISVISDFIPAYVLIHIPTDELVGGKMAALLARKKPRDYYDLYFMLRHPQLNRNIDKKQLKTVFYALKDEKIDFKRELSVLLPTSHHLILKNFKDLLVKEIAKYL
ncbi:nucleotidyl transferase AbiEii/AbiGii toxin family protein [Candidatus Saganbacteria bacterium]|nr:nucleotidyl transferase AbiEii/AbiGii toxin family protein [Candidatus Saganbacteria bacterium]